MSTNIKAIISRDLLFSEDVKIELELTPYKSVTKAKSMSIIESAMFNHLEE